MKHGDPRHGTTAGHNTGCLCAPCRAAKLRYDKIRRYDVANGRPRTVPAYRAARRVQALQCMGYSQRVIASLMGVHRRIVDDVSRSRGGVYVSTFEKLNAVYETHSMTYAVGEKVVLVRRAAERNGFAPPLAWLDIDDPDEQPDLTAVDMLPDLVVVERILSGDWRLRATAAERAEVVERWSRGINELERLTGWNIARDRRMESAA